MVTGRERVRIFTRELQLRTRTGQGCNSASEAEARVGRPRPSSGPVIFPTIAVNPATYSRGSRGGYPLAALGSTAQSQSAAAARNLRHNANRARPSTGKHTPRLGHSVPGARERGWLLAREESFRDPLQDHARIIPRPGGRRDCNQSSRAACRSLGRLGRRGGEQGTRL